MAELVVGIDGSAASQAALKWATEDLARRGGGRLHVLYSWEYPLAALAPSPVGTVVPPGDEMQEAAAAALDTMLHEAGLGDDPSIERHVTEGSPAQALLGVADEVDADLIIVGARGRGGFVGLLVGSVATQVVNHGKRPTVVVPAE